jgi:hypothetical protein
MDTLRWHPANNDMQMFSAHFEGLGVTAENLRYSNFSSAERYREAADFSTIDLSFPPKISIAHIDELLRRVRKKSLDAIFFPVFDVLTPRLEYYVGSCACLPKQRCRKQPKLLSPARLIGSEKRASHTSIRPSTWRICISGTAVMTIDCETYRVASRQSWTAESQLPSEASNKWQARTKACC